MSAAPATDFGRILFRISQLWRREVDGGMRRVGLNDATWRPLLYLGRLGEGVRQTDLAAALHIEGPSLVRLLDTLERAGLVERHPDAEDRRSKNLRMTPEGEQVYGRVEEAYGAVTERILTRVPPDQLALCVEVLGRVEQALLDGPAPADSQEELA
ncbi:MarR family winged helix-turn-helix transcriptional regulator [Roseomonas elaeocarpi]|uniref:MarR family winged helix-turn-helix transcriptional regulator n=1 Tax=Roseomonas elaeocarpi TaxID=907779 RepID=A0ABV6JSZ2_9PROT